MQSYCNYKVINQQIIFTITTPKSDYAFSILRENENIYCFLSFTWL